VALDTAVVVNAGEHYHHYYLLVEKGEEGLFFF
jgi:hypothetical protein